MFINRRTLQDAGLEVTLNKHGLSIQGTTPFPDDVREHADAIANLMQFDPMDHDRLIDHIGNAGVWRALRNCPTEI